MTRPLPSLLLLLLTVPAALAWPSPTCVSSGSTATLTDVPSTLNCIIVYDANWNTLTTSITTAGSGTITLQGLSKPAGNVEFYFDTACKTMIEEIGCTSGSAPPAATSAPPATTSAPPAATSAPPAATSAPPAATTKPTKAPAAPTTPAATNPPATSAPVSSGSSRAPSNVRAMYVWTYGNCIFNNYPASQYKANCKVAE